MDANELVGTESIVNRLKAIVENNEAIDKFEIDSLKQQFYKQHFAAMEKARKDYEDSGNDAASFIIPEDTSETEFKALMQAIKERRNALLLQQEQLKQENLAKKEAIIARIKEIIDNPESAENTFEEVRQLQQNWKVAGSVPPESATDLWKRYQLVIEQYYDIQKINNELRDLDFKKNLETKTTLCEQAEALAKSDDIIDAFQKLQQLHLEYKDCGPVAKELREDIWKRFKDASTVVNKMHQQHFEDIRQKELKNLEQKELLCQQIETIDFEKLTTTASWNEVAQKVLDAQAQWKQIGYAPQKQNTKIYERFRAACGTFFDKKNTFYKDLKDSLTDNLNKKLILCEKAEALQDSDDWKTTADAMIQLQKEWKSIGTVPKKDSDTVWKRFSKACDTFFDRKNKLANTQKNAELENLKKKKEIIAQVKELATSGNINRNQIRDIVKSWNEVGHVPFKEKDKLYKEFHTAIEEVEKLLPRRKETKDLTPDRMKRILDAKLAELKTYENNLGFLTANSKKGNALVDEMNRKMEKLKAEVEELKSKMN